MRIFEFNDFLSYFAASIMSLALWLIGQVASSRDKGFQSKNHNVVYVLKRLVVGSPSKDQMLTFFGVALLTVVILGFISGEKPQEMAGSWRSVFLIGLFFVVLPTAIINTIVEFLKKRNIG